MPPGVRDAAGEARLVTQAECQQQAATTSDMATRRSTAAKTSPASVGQAPIVALKNLGPKSTAFLRAAGITTLEQLASLGSVAAYFQVKQVEPKASLNLLWALEGALSGLHWREVAKEHRTSLLLALESHEQQHQRKNSRA